MAGDELVAVQVDDELCIGVGQCELLEPMVFRVDDDTGFASVSTGATLTRSRAEVVMAKCPSRAVKIQEAS